MVDTLDTPGQTGGGQRQRQYAGPESRIHYLTFKDFETMDTQNARIGLPSNRLAWLENLQPIGKNSLKQVPGPLAAVGNVGGKTILKKFYATFAPVGSTPVDYAIMFWTDGSATQFNLLTGATVTIAGPGTFTNPDMAQWQSVRIVIADPTAGYCTWDGSVFVTAGGVSPNIIVTNPGSGYTTGATAVISGGSGTGATCTVQTVAGFVAHLTLTNPGSGYKAGDTLTVTISPVGAGSGATATAIVFPILTIPNLNCIAVFQGRVWTAGNRTLNWSGTNGFDDAATANAAGSLIIPDSDLTHAITCLRSLNNFLYILGDSSIKQIGAITVASSVTLFTIVTLSSDQGTIFPLSVIAYNRLVCFTNFVGVWAIFGATVEKISDPMDGVFATINFTQAPIAVSVIINNIQVLLVLVNYTDPITGISRSIFMAFMNRKWFIVSQGNGILAAIDATINGLSQIFVCSGNDVTRALASATVPTSITVRTALSDDNGQIMKNKRGIRLGIAQSATSIGTMMITTDSETTSVSDVYVFGNPVIWINLLGGVVQWQNGSSQNVNFTNPGFLFQDRQENASGIYLGASMMGTFTQFILNSIVIEYEDGPYMRSINHG